MFTLIYDKKLMKIQIMELQDLNSMTSYQNESNFFIYSRYDVFVMYEFQANFRIYGKTAM